MSHLCLPLCPSQRFPAGRACGQPSLSPPAPPRGFPFPKHSSHRPSRHPPARSSVLRAEGTRDRKHPEKLWTNDWASKPLKRLGRGQGCWGTGACSSSASAGAIRVTHARAGAGWAVRPDTAPARIRKGSGLSVWSWQPVATSEMSKLVCETLSVPAASRLGGTAR